MKMKREIKELTSYLNQLKEERKTESIDLNINLKKIKQVNTVFIKKVNEMLLDMHKKIMSFEKLLKVVINTNENVDESITNVLLAIRQNEYLQAWYPPQNGQPAQKVIGKYIKVQKVQNGKEGK